MLYSVSINGKDMMSAYGLILLDDITIPAPAARCNRYTVPGADGDLDDTLALTGEPTYDPIDITFTLFARQPDKELYAMRTQLCNAYQGREVKVVFPHDSGHYYRGQLSIGQLSGYNSGRIPVQLHAYPWRLKHLVTEVSTNLTTSYKTLTLHNECRTAIPTITVERETTLRYGEREQTISSGTHRLPSICLPAGISILKAKVTSGTGAIAVRYQEASL